jgi:hypothetical protein
VISEVSPPSHKYTPVTNTKRHPFGFYVCRDFLFSAILFLVSHQRDTEQLHGEVKTMLNNGASVMPPYNASPQGALRLSQNVNLLDPAATQQLMGAMGSEQASSQAASSPMLPQPILDRDGVIHPEAAMAMRDQQLYGILALAKSNQRDAESKGAWTRGVIYGALAGALATGVTLFTPLKHAEPLIFGTTIAGLSALGGFVGAQEGAYIARNEYVARDLAVDGSLNGIALKA